MTSHTRARIIVFDVNETLLDIRAIEPIFVKVFGDAKPSRLWYSQLILYSEALALSGRYVDFGTLAPAILKMEAEAAGLSVSPADLEELTHVLKHLPPHDDVETSLQALVDAGFRLVTLTNSPPGADGSGIDRAGLSAYFNAQFSVHELKTFKPAQRTYQWVAQQMQTTCAALRLVAAHPWDTLGAVSAGCAAALILRPGCAPLRLPEFDTDIVGRSFTEVAQAIIAQD